MEVHGTHGCISLSHDCTRCTVRWYDPKRLPKSELDRSLTAPGRKYPVVKVDRQEERIDTSGKVIIDVYADLAKAIRTGSEPIVKPREALAVMRLLQKCQDQCKRIVATPI